MRRALPALAVLLGAALLAPGAAPPTAGTPAVVRPKKADDQLDYLFLGSDRPVLIRLHVRIGDKPYGARWNEFMDKLFAWFDKDKDGFLSPAEVARLPTAQHLGGMVQEIVRQSKEVVPFATLDADKDGKVSKKELRDYYTAGRFGPVTYSVQGYRAEFAKQINRAVYKRLDNDEDGKLTATKVAGMYRRLRALDENEDEILTAEELDTVTRNQFTSGVGLSRHSAGPGVRLLIEPDTSPPEAEAKPNLVRSMLARYDRVKDGKLSRAEVGLPAARFAALDANKDGLLDEAELRAYLEGVPDIVLRLQLASPQPGGEVRSHISIVNEKALPESLRKAVRRSGPDALSFDWGDTQLSLQLTPLAKSYELKKFYLEGFDKVAGKKGILTYAQVADERRRVISTLFAQADRNGDGQLTRAELSAWLDLIEFGQYAGASLIMYDLGRGLFPVLDADDDGRLTLREMRSAWSRLRPFAKDGKGVAQADLPRTLRLTVGLSQHPDFGFIPGSGPPLPRRVATARPPLWFVKMDRNNDGDVSRKEWLGTDEDFAAIDADGDGLISVDEALAFEAKKTKAKE